MLVAEVEPFVGVPTVIRCPRGHWLSEHALPEGHNLRWRERRCQRCASEGLPSYPIVFVRAADRAVSVVMWPCAIDPALLPWPAEGWR